MIRKTIAKCIHDVSRKSPQSEALVHTESGVRFNYLLLSWEIERFAKGLIQLGVQKKDRVALWATNRFEWIVSFLGIVAVGGVVVPINPDAGEEDLHYIMQQSGCSLLITEADGEDKTPVTAVESIRSNLPDLRQVVVTSNLAVPGTLRWRDVSERGDHVDDASLAEREGSVSPTDSVAIMYTSGTTGKPKGVVLDHIGLINKSMFSTRRQGIDGTDRLCLFFPLFHMFGNTCIALAGLLRGATLIMPCSKFEPVKILATVSKEKCTAIYGSPSMLIALLDHPAFRTSDWQSVSKGIIGGAPCPMELMRKLVEEIGVSDITVAYGITETSSWITMTRPGDPIDLRVSTIGNPLACNEIKIVDPNTGESLPPDRPGELCTRGFLMKRYYDMPAATAAAVDPEGWFHTGDLGKMDPNQYVRITGRLKDVIVRDGLEIYPVEIEEVLYELPEISEAQVFGFPHPDQGQEVAAWIKLKEGVSVSIDRVKAHIEARLEKEQQPRHYRFVSAFPMTGSGKIQKFKLAEMAEKDYLQAESNISKT